MVVRKSSKHYMKISK